MATLYIDDGLVGILNEFTDAQTAVNNAVKRYIFSVALEKIAVLSETDAQLATRYGCTYSWFKANISTDEEFVSTIEKINLNWETDLIEWEFTINAIDDWKKRLAHILPV